MLATFSQRHIMVYAIAAGAFNATPVTDFRLRSLPLQIFFATHSNFDNRPAPCFIRSLVCAHLFHVQLLPSPDVGFSTLWIRLVRSYGSRTTFLYMLCSVDGIISGLPSHIFGRALGIACDYIDPALGVAWFAIWVSAIWP